MFPGNPSGDGENTHRHTLLLERKHPKFYFSEGNFEFQVEGVLFKVHQYYFERDSPVFAAWLAGDAGSLSTKSRTPSADSRSGLEGRKASGGTEIYHRYLRRKTGDNVDGLDDTSAFFQDVTLDEMNAFMSVLYPLDLKNGDVHAQSEWISVLRLSTLWQFASIRALALRQLDPLFSPVDRLVVARSHNVESWVESALTDLCVRDNPLRLVEIRQMTYEDIALVGEIREAIRRPVVVAPLSLLLQRARDAIRLRTRKVSGELERHTRAGRRRGSVRETGSQMEVTQNQPRQEHTKREKTVRTKKTARSRLEKDAARLEREGRLRGEKRLDEEARLTKGTRLAEAHRAALLHAKDET